MHLKPQIKLVLVCVFVHNLFTCITVHFLSDDIYWLSHDLKKNSYIFRTYHMGTLGSP